MEEAEIIGSWAVNLSYQVLFSELLKRISMPLVSGWAKETPRSVAHLAQHSLSAREPVADSLVVQAAPGQDAGRRTERQHDREHCELNKRKSLQAYRNAAGFSREGVHGD